VNSLDPIKMVGNDKPNPVGLQIQNKCYMAAETCSGQGHCQCSMDMVMVEFQELVGHLAAPGLLEHYMPEDGRGVGVHFEVPPRVLFAKQAWKTSTFRATTTAFPPFPKPQDFCQMNFWQKSSRFLPQDFRNENNSNPVIKEIAVFKVLERCSALFQGICFFSRTCTPILATALLNYMST
jgi:hypothetical protein